MEAERCAARPGMRVPRLLCLVFAPTVLLLLLYVAWGLAGCGVPSLLLFCLLALALLLPLELSIVLRAGKREQGYYSLKSAWCAWGGQKDGAQGRSKTKPAAVHRVSLFMRSVHHRGLHPGGVGGVK